MNTLLVLMAAVTLTLHVRTPYTTRPGEGLNTCTAVMIGPNEALTAAHCIHGGKNMKAWVRDGHNKSFSVTLLDIDVTNDIALLHIKGSSHPWVRLGAAPSKADRVYTYNSGEDMIGTYAEGVISNQILDPVTETPELLHTVPILAGASGSGLFNQAGELVGINTMSDRVFSMATDILPIRHFLERTLQKQQIQSIQGI